MPASKQLSTEDAVRQLRGDSRFAELVHYTYLDEDVVAAATRFAESGEWIATRNLLNRWIAGGTVVDLGAGNGMASRAFALAGAARVFAIEPDASSEIGRGAIARVCSKLPVETFGAFGEALPLPDKCADVVYARQVLHHTGDLAGTLRECSRVLRCGGVFIATREHVADSAEELARFLALHPIHALTGGENAYPLSGYRAAIKGAGLQLQREFGPWDSVINLYPAVSTDAEIPALPARRLREHFGWIGAVLCKVPGVTALVARRMRRPISGRLYSFLAIKP